MQPIGLIKDTLTPSYATKKTSDVVTNPDNVSVTFLKFLYKMYRMTSELDDVAPLTRCLRGNPIGTRICVIRHPGPRSAS